MSDLLDMSRLISGKLTVIKSKVCLKEIIKQALQGKITIAGKLCSDSVEVAISDTGVGIPPERLEEVFQQFARIPDPTLVADGVGLGLYIVKLLVHEHGGTVTAKSNGKGKGSEFVVRLPREL